MLGFYASKFPAVEINNTFYRLPKEHVLQRLGGAGAGRRSRSRSRRASASRTTRASSRSARARVEFLLKNTSSLGDRLGPILFQLPPNLKKDVDRLRGFLGAAARRTAGTRSSSGTRAGSTTESSTELRERDIALCIREQPRNSRRRSCRRRRGATCVSTASTTTDPMLADGQQRMAAQPWNEAYVFFKHDYIDGSGPLAVERFVKLIAAPPISSRRRTQRFRR